jgi:hypothetical protein
MGTWSIEPFGNDHAADWVIELENAEDLTPIRDAIEAVIDAEDEYLEASDSEIAVAAIAVLARVHGASAEEVPLDSAVEEWIARVEADPDPALVDLAFAALDRIVGEQSELRELWEETDEFEAWMASMQALRAGVAG